MATKQCPRCGNPVAVATGRRGRPSIWCSSECRRLASEERRAARTAGQPVEVREQIRERVVERSRPLSPEGAIDRVLSDDAATEKLLRVLAHRLRKDPPYDPTPSWNQSRMKPLIYDLWQAYHGAADSAPVAMPAANTVSTVSAAASADAHRAAVALVLSSPRSTREILATLTEWARTGTLARGEHTGTLRAAEALLENLRIHRLLPRR